MILGLLCVPLTPRAADSENNLCLVLVISVEAETIQNHSFPNQLFWSTLYICIHGSNTLEGFSGRSFCSRLLDSVRSSINTTIPAEPVLVIGISRLVLLQTLGGPIARPNGPNLVLTASFATYRAFSLQTTTGVL